MVWDARGGSAGPFRPQCSGRLSFPRAVAWDPAGEVLAAGFTSGEDLSSGQRRVCCGRSPAIWLSRRIGLVERRGRLAALLTDHSIGVWSREGELQWTGVVLSDGSQATFSGQGTLLHGSVEKVDAELAFLMDDGAGRHQWLDYSAFAAQATKTPPSAAGSATPNSPSDANAVRERVDRPSGMGESNEHRIDRLKPAKDREQAPPPPTEAGG